MSFRGVDLISAASGVDVWIAEQNNPELRRELDIPLGDQTYADVAASTGTVWNLTVRDAGLITRAEFAQAEKDRVMVVSRGAGPAHALSPSDEYMGALSFPLEDKAEADRAYWEALPNSEEPEVGPEDFALLRFKTAEGAIRGSREFVEISRQLSRLPAALQGDSAGANAIRLSQLVPLAALLAQARALYSGGAHFITKEQLDAALDTPVDNPDFKLPPGASTVFHYQASRVRLISRVKGDWDSVESLLAFQANASDDMRRGGEWIRAWTFFADHTGTPYPFALVSIEFSDTNNKVVRLVPADHADLGVMQRRLAALVSSGHWQPADPASPLGVRILD